MQQPKCNYKSPKHVKNDKRINKKNNTRKNNGKTQIKLPFNHKNLCFCCAKRRRLNFLKAECELIVMLYIFAKIFFMQIFCRTARVRESTTQLQNNCICILFKVETPCSKTMQIKFISAKFCKTTVSPLCKQNVNFLRFLNQYAVTPAFANERLGACGHLTSQF